MTKRRICTVALAAVSIIGTALVWSGVSMMERSAVADVSLYPYIARAFAWPALMGIAVTVHNVEVQK